MKKEYIVPQMLVVGMATTSMICGSKLGDGPVTPGGKYGGEFSSRRYRDWDDEDEEEDF